MYCQSKCFQTPCMPSVVYDEIKCHLFSSTNYICIIVLLIILYDCSCFERRKKALSRRSKINTSAMVVGILKKTVCNILSGSFCPDSIMMWAFLVPCWDNNPPYIERTNNIAKDNADWWVHTRLLLVFMISSTDASKSHVLGHHSQSSSRIVTILFSSLLVEWFKCE